MSNAGHDHHTAHLVPEPVSTETPVEYGRRVHRALGEKTCECPSIYKMCRWVTHHRNTFVDFSSPLPEGRVRVW